MSQRLTVTDFKLLSITEQEFWKVTAQRDGVSIENVYLIEWSHRRITYHTWRRDGMGIIIVRDGEPVTQKVRRCR